MTGFGNVLLGLSFIAAIISVVSLFWGRSMGSKDGESVTNMGYYATFGGAAALTLATSVLLSAFFRNDFAFKYVAEHHPTDVSKLTWLYKISGVWAGREGSLMFWAWLVALFAAYIAWRRMTETDDLSNMALAVLNIVQCFFLASLFIPLNNPFQASPAAWLGANGELLIGQVGMNPLLQHWAMILHPPTLFVGYAGLAVPFAFAIGALIVNDPSKRWVELSDRITIFSWLFLGIGIGLGSIWAYVVLGWGGYWAWDPVENASLLPWLTGVGLLHSFTVYRRRGGFKKWSVLLASVTFTLVILGTFITRSGVIQSVHAFQRDPWSLGVFLAMMIGALGAGIIGLMIRSESFQGVDEFESLTSKESSYYFNNVIMLMSSVLVAMLTLSPAFGFKTFGPETYDAIAHPFGIFYVAIMAVCPLLSWRKTEGPAFMRKAKWPFLATMGLMVPLGAIWYFDLWPTLQANGALSAWEPVPIVIVYSLLGFIVGAFAVSVAVFMFVEGARKRAAAKGESFWAALGNIMLKARTQSGGYLTHMGMGIILIGLVGSTMFVADTQPSVKNEAGTQLEVGGYTLTYQGLDTQNLTNGDVVTTALFDVSRGGRLVGTANPGQVQFYRQQSSKLNADVIVEPLRDIFIVFQGLDPQTNELSLQVKINPLISWAWAGFLLTIIGSALAMWPKKQVEAMPVPASRKNKK